MTKQEFKKPFTHEEFVKLANLKVKLWIIQTL